jgi:hypothetical protein
MEKRHNHRRLWIVTALAGLSITAGIGLGQIKPVGRKAGLIQFDAITELNMDQDDRHTVVFARYWVCQDYYAVAVAWSEPHGGGLMYTWKSLVVLSDKTGFRMGHETNHDWGAVNTTYPKPLGERGPFQPMGGGIPRLMGMPFAEAEALARRVYVSDLGSLKDASRDTHRVVDLKVPGGTDGIERKLAQLKVRAKGNRIESMDLLDAQQRSLGTMKYECDRGSNVSPLARLVAELPAKPQKVAVDANVTNSSGGVRKTYEVKDIDYVSHKGGRTCTVTYKDVTIGDQVLRLPVHVEVHVSEDKRLLRSARLINFKRVNLDKTGVWEAARAFAHLSDEDQAYYKLVRKYFPSPFRRKPAPMTVDPNDKALVARLIAKYPVWELPPAPHGPEPQARPTQGSRELTPEARMQQARMRAETRKQELAKRQEQAAKPPRPPRMEIEPNDVRMIRQLCRYHDKKLMPPLTQEQSKLLKERGWLDPGGLHEVPESERELHDLHTKLHRILAYHRVPSLPEDNPPRVEPADCELIQQLQAHYEKLATQRDRGLEGRLKALDALTRMDTIVNDYRAFEGHTIRYLQTVEDANLAPMYMAGGYESLETLMKVGRYEEANRLLRQWADRSAAENDAEAILRFARYGVCRAGHWWTSVHLLDGFLKKRGLTREQRYEGLALRAVALHKIDKLLGSLEPGDSERGMAQGQWVLSTAKRAELAKKVEPALREALAAWNSLGKARWSEAKPYSTASEPAANMNLMGFPEATALQETSWFLNNAIQERAGQTAAGRSKASR